MSPYKKVFMFSGLILFLPVFMYFFSKDVIFHGFLGMEGTNSIFYAAMTSVVTVHIVLAMFLWAAFTEEEHPAPTSQDIKKD